MIARWFFVTAVVYGLLGLAIGLHMAISHDHAQTPSHAHVQVLGWLSFFAFGVFYKLFPAAADGLLAKAHFWLAQLSVPVMLFGVWSIYGGNPEREPFAAVGSIVYALSFVVFSVNVFKTTDR